MVIIIKNKLISLIANHSKKAFLVILFVSFVSVTTFLFLCYKWQYAQILAAFPNKLDRYKIVDIGVPAGYETSGGIGIDDAGNVSGWAKRANDQTGRFLWRHGMFLRVKQSNLQIIDRVLHKNDRGDVLTDVSGLSDQLREVDSQPILKVKHGIFTFQLGIRPEEGSNFFNVYANEVNNSRQVVGSMCDWSSCHAFLWQGGSAIDLSARLDEKDWILNSADGINNSGSIVGTGSRFGKTQTFLFVPTR